MQESYRQASDNLKTHTLIGLPEESRLRPTAFHKFSKDKWSS
ncbi:hypothetical protein CLV45_3966 [Hymenobacter chitinivorans DSM 11115]|uniref:Uncharacterized protein n=1 Tax=Hymenobacter chitinivorans DSM 11115 TaxID=1121954 RepID=A0A2M9B5T0_9BACT|nr:hypothetical protein CLV45_3966 [Hymenobacter chitinivorans DSM 11115]